MIVRNAENNSRGRSLPVRSPAWLLAPLILALCGAWNRVFAEECVVLLHGLGRSSSSMSGIEERLQNAGYRVVNFDYPSRSSSIEVLADVAVAGGLQECAMQGAQRTHFITHSLGGILVRQYFKAHDTDQLGRVVMLGPPNHGSEVVDQLRDWPGYELLNGPAGTQLGTDPENFIHQLGPVHFELGVIAGTQSINPLFDLLLPDPNDGTVTVESTRVEGMQDHLLLPVSHSLMMFDGEVMDNALHFLRTGRFMAEE